jgi:hypothetical protein
MGAANDFMEWGVRMACYDDGTGTGSRELCKTIRACVGKKKFIGMLRAAVKEANGVVRH